MCTWYVSAATASTYVAIHLQNSTTCVTTPNSPSPARGTSPFASEARIDAARSMSGLWPFIARLRIVAGHDQPVDLVGALEDPVDARVAEEPLGGILLDEAVAAVDLHALVGAVVEHLGAEDLDDRRLDRELLDGRDVRVLVRRSAAKRSSMRPVVR